MTIIGLLVGLQSYSQLDCRIFFNIFGETATYHQDTTLCRGQRLTLFTGYSDTLNYLWEPGGETTHEIEAVIDTVERTYRLYIRNESNILICEDSLKLSSYIITDPEKSDSIFCYKETIRLGTKPRENIFFRWRPGNVTEEVYEFTITDTTTYYLDVFTLPDSTLLCTDSIKYYTYPRMVIEFEQISKGCPNDCKAQVTATASEGFPPYRYVWNATVAPNDSSLALGLCSEDTYDIRVYDTLCLFDTTYQVESFKLPEIEISFSPDTIYLTNPRAEFSFENKSDTIGITNWIWLFPDSTTTNDLIASHVFQDTASVVSFIYTTDDGCVDTMKVTVPLKEFEMDIPNVFTPNGDGANDVWEIRDLEKYISNQIVIFDRWGKKVFEASGYQNNWDGGRLGDGVYFFILKCVGFWKEDIYKGSVTIIGSPY